MAVYNPSGSGNVHVDKVLGNGKPGPVKATTIPVKKATGRKTVASAAVKKSAARKK